MKEDLKGISRYRRFRTFSRKRESGILEKAKENLGERLMCRMAGTSRRKGYGQFFLLIKV